MNVTKEVFGHTRQGDVVHRYTLTNDQGMIVQVLNLGGIIQSIHVPDKHGQLGNVVLGCDSVQDYERQDAYLGAIIGRCANRIAKGRFTLEDKTYQLACNNGPNHLHGGTIGFSHRIWDCQPYERTDSCGVRMSLFSPDGEEGYPGNLEVTVDYNWNNQGELAIEYQATTDKTTVVNMTQHSYFNLRGKGDCLGHEIQLNASHYLPTDPTGIPTGEIALVADTPMDFRTAKTIGRDIKQPFEQLIQAKGYDHSWVVDGYQHDNIEPVTIAEVSEPASGRTLKVLTTKPGVQLYTGNFLEGVPARNGDVYNKHDGFCLETQFFPDDPNKYTKSRSYLFKQEVYKTITMFCFKTLE